MPSRNSVKFYLNDEYYHVYNRGASKQAIFLDDADYAYFLSLLKDYLTPEKLSTANRSKRPTYHDRVELLAYCLMPNHFHLLFYQTGDKGITAVMRSLCTSYSMYFNKKYDHSGTIFQGIFKASRINSDMYLHHISRYIHLNPAMYKLWSFSSFQSYAGTRSSAWINPDRILTLFDNSPQAYMEFVDDYSDYKHNLDRIKHELAGF